MIPEIAEMWRRIAQAKIVCAATSEEQLLQLQQHAEQLHLPSTYIPEHGIGIFGDLNSVNQVTGSLKLY